MYYLIQKDGLYLAQETIELEDIEHLDVEIPTELKSRYTWTDDIDKAHLWDNKDHATFLLVRNYKKAFFKDATVLAIPSRQ